ncbi:MAG: RnfH family protein [Idiomarina sp.]|nr:RnfH family protein [Idiomarina sp.]
MSDALLNIEVVYGTPERQKIVSLSVTEGTTVLAAIEQSNIQTYFPEIVPSEAVVGIWNKSCKLTDKPRQGDRIEIYRPLIADPKENRRRRAEQAKDEGRADRVTGGRPDRQRRQGTSTDAVEGTEIESQTDASSNEQE